MKLFIRDLFLTTTKNTEYVAEGVWADVHVTRISILDLRLNLGLVFIWLEREAV